MNLTYPEAKHFARHTALWALIVTSIFCLWFGFAMQPLLPGSLNVLKESPYKTTSQLQTLSDPEQVKILSDGVAHPDIGLLFAFFTMPVLGMLAIPYGYLCYYITSFLQRAGSGWQLILVSAFAAIVATTYAIVIIGILSGYVQFEAFMVLAVMGLGYSLLTNLLAVPSYLLWIRPKRLHRWQKLAEIYAADHATT